MRKNRKAAAILVMGLLITGSLLVINSRTDPASPDTPAHTLTPAPSPSETVPPESPTPSTTDPAAVTSPSPLPEDLPAAAIISIESLDELKMKTYFNQSEISEELYNRMYGKSYKKDCTILLEDLRYIRVLHYGFDEKTHIGELVVNAAIADTVLKIFKELYDARYPIEKMVLIDEYDADDEASMADNNSSCFNYRMIDGTNTPSKHGQGLAIDINPLYNPYVRSGKGERSVLPVNGASYADRTLACPYYIDTSDFCYQTFIKYGFTWGGSWTSSKDYQHFQISIDE